MSPIRPGLARATSCVCAAISLLIGGCVTIRGIPGDEITTSLPIALPPANFSDVLAPLEIPGLFFSAGGLVCLDAIDDPEVDVTHDGSQDLPAWAQRATVFLNGWRLRYLSKDHHVKSLWRSATCVESARCSAGVLTAQSLIATTMTRTSFVTPNAQGGSQLCSEHG
jgi:hypothetical protein